MDTSTIVSGLFSIETKRTSASTMDTVDTSDGEYSNPDEHETAVSDVPEEIGDSVPTEEADDLINNREEELGSDDVAVDDGTHTDSAKEDASSTDEKAESAQNVVEMDGEASPCKEETTASIDGSEVAVPNSTDDREPPEQVEDRNEELEHKKDAEPTETAPPCVEDEVTRPVARIFPKTSQHRIPSRAAIKVIKGEIHNVLTVLRDQRYVSRSRFTQEIVEDDEDLNSTSHPVVQALQDLHTQVTAAAELVAMQPDLVIDVDYLEPFCQCIELPEISAVVTGKALGSLHKFVLYGFVSPSSSSISYQGNKEPLGAVMRIAEALLSCTFEETVTGVMANQGDADNSDSGGAPNHLRPVGNRSLAHLRRRKAGSKDDLLFDDEQTVLKLLDVAALVVRTSMQDDAVHLVQAPTISRLMDTCLHVSHRAEKATPLLKSAAFSALSQIVLQVFAAPGYEPVMQARREILEKLATLLNPKHTEAAANGDATSTPGKKAKSADSKQKQVNHSVVTNGLTLVNIALEACREPLTREEVQILQNDVCRYLLQWSHSSHDLSLLSLTLRVIFNLFQSIRNELKVPLEVFLTSIHMRIINDDSCVRHSPEEREVALESLVEFCQEPDMVQDIYLNYDCDVACSNLYEAIVTALGKAATPVGWEDEGIFSDESNADYTENEEVDMASKHSAHNSSDEGMAGRKISKKLSATESVIASNRDPAVSNQVSPVTHLHRLSMEGLLSVLESIAKRCTGKAAAFKQSSRADSGISEAESSRSWDPNDASQITTEELHERKRRKHALVKIGRVFNSSSSSSEWLDLAVKEGVLESKESVEGVADVLFTASMLDKAKVGIYLSKGPDDAYPFNAAVRQAFVGRYDFSDMTFAAALRKFLSKFRLPGEAQCIDRIMESFSKELYRQQGETSFFKSADAVFVLAFSTIMLNTDLHNPMIKQENRMTLEQFVKNNRGINDGEDLPEDFLVELYEQIKSKQIEVRKELGDIIKQHGEQEDFRKVWDNMLSKKGEVALPFFSQAGFSRSTSQVAGFHHKEMFIGLAKPAIQAFAGIFQRSWDDGLVVKALNGLQTICRVAAYFECGSILDDVLNILLPMGTDYVMNAIVTDRSGSQTVNDSHPDKEGEDDFDRNGLGRPIPYGLLCSYRGKEDVDITGSAYHRGLLALDCGFIVVRKYTARVVSAWPSFIECICALRDAHALPGGMTDLDDFADSNGNVLPQSTFAKTSQRRLHEVYRAHSEEEKAAKNKGWLRSIFRRNSKDTDELEDQLELPGKGNKLSKVAKALLEVAEASDVEAVVHLATGQSDVKRKIQLQIDCLDDFPFKHDPVGEQHAIFSIELATRALLSNRDHALEWFIPFLNKFEVVLSAVTSTKVPAPFVIERIVVTILRCCIHLYDIEETRGQLKASLHLVMMSLPKNFIKVIADRMACGLAIVLRNSFYLFDTPNDWTFLGDTMDTLAHFNNSRVFVFDGMASTVEFALSQVDSQDPNNTEQHSTLTMDASLEFSKILIRFVLAFYQGDVAFCLPAMLCLEKVYRHIVELELQQTERKIEDVTKAAPNEELFQNMAVAIYTVCRSADVELSSEGAKCFRRVVIRTDINEITGDKWIDIMYLMANKQPQVTADASRGTTFSLLGQLASHVLPHLSHDKDMREDLVDIVQQFAQLARENLRQGRRGKVSPLFEKTLQTVTYLSNLMVTEEWKGDTEFSTWASEVLLSELERVGAAGASLHNQKATKPKPTPITTNTPNAQGPSSPVVRGSPTQPPRASLPPNVRGSLSPNARAIPLPNVRGSTSPNARAIPSPNLRNAPPPLRGGPIRGGRGEPPPNYRGPGGPPPHVLTARGRGVPPNLQGRGPPPQGRGPPHSLVGPNILNSPQSAPKAAPPLSEPEKVEVEAS